MNSVYLTRKCIRGTLPDQPLLIVGDLHGRREILDAVLEYENSHSLIFLGDLVDGIRPISDQLYCLDIVLDGAIEERWDLILGNHELSYLVDHMQASRFQLGVSVHIQHGPAKNGLLGKGLPFIWFTEDNLLVTHAGLDQDNYAQLEGDDEIEQAHNLLEHYLSRTSITHGIGRSRGGRDKRGGIFWCDFRFEFLPTPGLNQVCGHTKHNDVSVRTSSEQSTTPAVISNLDLPNLPDWSINIDVLGNCPKVLEISKTDNKLIPKAITLEL